MKRSSIIFVCVCLMALFVYTGSAQAESAYLGTWSGIYPNSLSDNVGCTLCHSNTPSLNAYGNDIAGNGNISVRIVDAEDFDSDGDPGGFTNIEEINANTQPGWTVGDNGAPGGNLDPAIQLPSNETSCTDNVDNDGDGATDCNDQDCADAPACQPPLPSNETSCTDNVDNDGDNFVDCADTDCANDTACQPVEPPVEPPVDPPVEAEVCDDGQDNDLDGFTDCDDQDCSADPVCDQQPVVEDCADGVDNDGDGFVDCMDTDCAADPSCQVAPSQPQQPQPPVSDSDEDEIDADDDDDNDMRDRRRRGRRDSDDERRKDRRNDRRDSDDD